MLRFREVIGLKKAALLIPCLLACAPSACSKPTPRPFDSPRPLGDSDAFAGVNCAAIRAPVEPDLMAWDPSLRAQLDRLRKQSVVAVRYEAKGCDVSLELLPECIGPKNKYVYVPFNAADTKIARDVNELFAQLPVGASNVSGLLRGKRAVRTDFKLVGSLALPPGSTITEYDLVGPECKRATHVISTVYVGGFAMTASDPRQVESLGNLLVAPPNDGLTREGQAGICDQALLEGKELGGCSVPLRVALLPLDGKAPVPRCSEGFSWNGGSCARPVCKSETPEDQQKEQEATGCTIPASPASSPTEDAGAAATDGMPRPLDQNAIERVVRQHQGNVKRSCWDGTSETLRRVTVSVIVTVDTKGQVASAEPQTTDFDGPADAANVVGRCVASDVRTWRFPEPDAQKVLTLPFHFIRQ